MVINPGTATPQNLRRWKQCDNGITDALNEAKVPNPTPHPRVELRANLNSISYRCHLFEVAFVWELTKESIHLPLGCLQGGSSKEKIEI